LDRRKADVALMGAKMLNVDKVKARLARVAAAVIDAVEAQLKIEVADLVEAQKRAAPVDETSKTPGNFRDATRAYKTPNRPLSYRVINDAKDEDGAPIAQHIEHGHKAKDGTHVPPQPSFFPTYRARKKGMQRRLKAAARKAIKQIYPG
jgi:hypothetical protein